MKQPSLPAETCIAPQEIVEGDLLAYVYGDAGPAVAAHIRRCPACQSAVRVLQQSEKDLLTTFFRADCPAADELLAHHEGRLGGNQQLIVTAHVRDCPHCSEELMRLQRADRAGALLERLRAGVGVLRGVLAPWPGQPAALRGGSAGQQLHQAPGVDVLLDVQPALAWPARYTLHGLVIPRGDGIDLPGIDIWLLRGDEVLGQTTTSETGRFELLPTPAGRYGLLFNWGDKTVWLPEVDVG